MRTPHPLSPLNTEFERMSQTAFLFDDRVLEAPGRSERIARQVFASDAASALPQEYLTSQKIREILGPVGTCLTDCFHRMTLAEDAIKRFCAKYPRHAPRLNRAFGILNWRLPERVRDRIYKAHLDELLQRVVDGDSVSAGTRAEVLVFLSSASLCAPFGQQAVAAFGQLFREILGAEAHFEDDRYPREPWCDASEELIADLRQRLSAEDRTDPTKGDRQ
jgi:hypothetical protein